MTNLRELIQQCIDAKQGSKEFALFYVEGIMRPWWAEIGNPGSAVLLGESSGEFRGEGDTPEAAVSALLQNIRNGVRHT